MCVCVCVSTARFFLCSVVWLRFFRRQITLKVTSENSLRCLVPVHSSATRFKHTHTWHNGERLFVVLKRNYILWESWKKQPNQFEWRLISSCFILSSFWQFRLRFIKVNMKTFRHVDAHTRREIRATERTREIDSQVFYSPSLSTYQPTLLPHPPQNYVIVTKISEFLCARRR